VPDVTVASAAAVGLPAAGGRAVALHVLRAEPSHDGLLELARALRASGHSLGVALIGALTPGGPADVPQLRGVLVCADDIPPDAAVFGDAVQHGWYPCLTPGTRRLAFARGGEGVCGDYRTGWPPAVLPALRARDLRLWRWGRRACALGPPGAPPATRAAWCALVEESERA
jgi:hypothetical protein